MAHLSGDNEQKLAELNEFLAKSNYVNGDHPGAEDARVFATIKSLPAKAQFPEVHFWYLIVSAFTPAVRQTWSGVAAPAGEKKGEQKKPEQKKPEQKKEAKKDDDIDLFGDDDAPAQAPQPKKEAPKKKKEVIAKTIIIFDVKVYEAEDVKLLEDLAKKIREEIQMDGLVWGKEHKIIEVAYGAKKLQLSMVVEDLKVYSDDVFDKITAWEDVVQSVDIASMQKV